MRQHLPIALTWSRIALIPVLVITFYLPWPGTSVACAILFALASLTDWLDGYLARRWHQETALGAFLDPVADKLMVATVLVLLAGHDGSGLVVISAAVIIAREITISALREWMAVQQATAIVAVAWLGKLKTATQMAALVILLAFLASPNSLGYRTGVVILLLAAGLALWSMVNYCRAALTNMAGARKRMK